MIQIPKDYAGQPDEVQKHPTLWPMMMKIAESAAPEHQAAFLNAMRSFWCMAHAWDDLIDGSGWPEEKKMLAWKALHDFTADLLTNPVFTAHGPQFAALFRSAIARQTAGDKMTERGGAAAQLAPAVKCADIDLLVEFAWLAGGWGLMQGVSELREYDEPDAPAEGGNHV